MARATREHRGHSAGTIPCISFCRDHPLHLVGDPKGPLVLGISDQSHPLGLESTFKSIDHSVLYYQYIIVSVSLLQLLLQTQVRNWIQDPGATVPTSRVMSPYVTPVVRRLPAPSPRLTYPEYTRNILVDLS